MGNTNEEPANGSVYLRVDTSSKSYRHTTLCNSLKNKWFSLGCSAGPNKFCEHPTTSSAIFFYPWAPHFPSHVPRKYTHTPNKRIRANNEMSVEAACPKVGSQSRYLSFSFVPACARARRIGRPHTQTPPHTNVAVNRNDAATARQSRQLKCMHARARTHNRRVALAHMTDTQPVLWTSEWRANERRGDSELCRRHRALYVAVRWQAPMMHAADREWETGFDLHFSVSTQSIMVLFFACLC